MKFIFSLLVAVLVGSLFCSAADLDSSDYYSLSPVQSLSPTVNSALDYAVQPLADTTSGWSSDDSENLYEIYRALIFNVPAYDGSIVESLRDIRDALVISPTVSSGSLVDNVRKIYLSASSAALSLEEINDAVQNDYDSLKELLKSIWGDTESIDSTLSSFLDIFNHSFVADSIPIFSGGSLVGYWNFPVMFGALFQQFVNGGSNAFSNGTFTLYQYVRNLSDVLASEDDVLLAESQKANREEIESSFLTGSSSSTSLGVSDFGDLADVGGTIKDSLSLDGNATIGSFTSGLAAADSAGQGWFSEETRSQLDDVSSTVIYSLRDPDPYNMAGWEDRYYWLLGDDE